jgi:hypothetical protein
MDAVLGGLRTGCGQVDQAVEGSQVSGMTKGQAFLVSQKILSIWVM